MPSAHDQYLSTKIMTATPQKLHLMLIEGAIRRLIEAKATWSDPGKTGQRGDALSRCIDITGELLASVRKSGDPLAKQFAAVYAFIFRTITEAKMHDDLDKLQDALRLLGIERETWFQVCNKFCTEDGANEPEAPTAENRRQEPSDKRPPAEAARHARSGLGSIPTLPARGKGLSLEA